ncbi:MAG: pyridoxamine 5'-phosphate oxidase family protein [Gemmatimonadaceae bacterium]|nr:pyridoxamine 5'-phosphate oxidase family protein [Gemmatimonadaceae bacterium]
MHPFLYHEGQRDVQREANSVQCADNLSTWVGPVVDYANEADLVVLASATPDTLHVAALSGPAPLVSAAGHAGAIAVSMTSALVDLLPIERPWGGIVINPATARRSRVAGHPQLHGSLVEVPCGVAFTNCRKYMTPTSSTGASRHLGPTAQERRAPDDQWVVDTIARGETAFLVTVTPEGVADVSHRGGQPGFLRYDAVNSAINWTEYLGDGMFVSTGNLRRSRRFALLVLDYESGDAVRLDGEANYTNLRRDRHERVDALLQASEPFPVQGTMEATVHYASRLVQFCQPRVRVERRTRITSADTTAVQHPQ